MKKAGLLILVIILLVILVGCASSSAPAPKPTPQEPIKPYYTEQLTPEIIRVVAVQIDGMRYDMGYGNALALAVKEIGKKYNIVQISPINYLLQYGSATKELYITVK